MVRIDLGEEDKAHLAPQCGAEIGMFVDGRYYAEDEVGYTPYNWVWDSSDVEPGERVLTINVSSFKDQIGVKSLKVLSGNDERAKPEPTSRRSCRTCHGCCQLGVLAAQSGTGAAAPGIIAFTAQVDKNWELFVSHSDGTGVRQYLTHTPYDEREPAISPDGRVIAVSTSGGGIELVSVAAGDGPEVLALPKGWFGHPAWWSDGSRLLLVRT